MREFWVMTSLCLILAGCGNQLNGTTWTPINPMLHNIVTMTFETNGAIAFNAMGDQGTGKYRVHDGKVYVIEPDGTRDVFVEQGKSLVADDGSIWVIYRN